MVFFACINKSNLQRIRREKEKRCSVCLQSSSKQLSHFHHDWQTKWPKKLSCVDFRALWPSSLPLLLFFLRCDIHCSKSVSARGTHTKQHTHTKTKRVKTDNRRAASHVNTWRARVGGLGDSWKGDSNGWLWNMNRRELNGLTTGANNKPRRGDGSQTQFQQKATWNIWQWYLPRVLALFAASPSAVTFINIWWQKKKKKKQRKTALNFQSLGVRPAF